MATTTKRTNSRRSVSFGNGDETDELAESSHLGLTGTDSLAGVGTQTQIRLQRLVEDVVYVPIVGRTPYIPHKWSEKALAMMRAKQQQVEGGQTTQREAKKPEQEAFDSTYWMLGEDGQPRRPLQIGAPATGFKAAMVGACRFFDGLTMTAAKNLFFVRGVGIDQLVPIIGEWEMFEAAVRNQTGVADLRYRNRVSPWRATLEIEYLASRITRESIVALVDAGGRGGIGDWRPSAPKSATGVFGQWLVADDAIAVSVASSTG